VCEGQLDLIACFRAGVQNIVAPQGTAFTDQHARIMKRYVDEVVLCFDSDNAGQNAAVRALDSLLASGLAVRVAVVPAPHDPDSFIKANGGDAFRKLIEGAEGFFDYYLNRLCQTNDITSDKGRLVVLREMAEAVRKTGNTVLVDKHAQKTALRLGVAADAVRAEFKKAAPPQFVPTEPEEESFETAAAPAADLPPPSVQELWLLKLALKHEAGAEWLVGHLDPNWIQHETVRTIVTRWMHSQTEGAHQSLGQFLDSCSSEFERSLITAATMEERPIPNPEQQLGDVTLKLRNQSLDRQMAALTQRISQPETGDPEKLDLMRQQQELRQLKRAPLIPLAEQH
jgi:DNA primase